MTIIVTIEPGLTMKVEDVEEYILDESGLTIKKKWFKPMRLKGTDLKVEELK